MTVLIDGVNRRLDPSPRLDGDGILVPLAAFCELVEAEAKEVNGVLAVCREDLCIPLDESVDLVSFDGVRFARLSSFGGALGLAWSVDRGVLRVQSGRLPEQVGLEIGNRPPEFTLPDLYTGEPVGPAHFKGKRAVFFMWASW